LRVDYYSGILQCASEWVCFDHIGYASQKAVAWWLRRSWDNSYPNSVANAIEILQEDPDYLQTPCRIATRKNGKYTEVKNYEFD
jgi:DNA repair protein RadD